MLPLVGATTLRDFLGGLADVSVLPIAVGKPFSSLKYSIPAYTVNSLEFRIEFDERLEAIRAADDPYTDRKGVVEGKSVEVRVDLGGRRQSKKKQRNKN